MMSGWRRSRWCVALAALTSLSACGSPQPVVSRALVAAPPDTIDGQYRGIARLVRASIAGCPRSGRRTVVISGGAMSVPYRGARASVALVATVNADGAVSGSDGAGTVQGQISGHHLDLLVSSEFCDLRYALDRS